MGMRRDGADEASGESCGAKAVQLKHKGSVHILLILGKALGSAIFQGSCLYPGRPNPHSPSVRLLAGAGQRVPSRSSVTCELPDRVTLGIRL
jgi:hypothetical protein